MTASGDCAILEVSVTSHMPAYTSAEEFSHEAKHLNIKRKEMTWVEWWPQHYTWYKTWAEAAWRGHGLDLRFWITFKSRMCSFPWSHYARPQRDAKAGPLILENQTRQYRHWGVNLAQNRRWSGFKYTRRGAGSNGHRWGSLGLLGEVRMEEGKHKHKGTGAVRLQHKLNFFTSFNPDTFWLITGGSPYY